MVGNELEPSRTVRIGTRGSHLARWQSEWVAARLGELYPGLKVELVEIKTQGDRDRVSPLSAIGGMGLFTKEIQRALIDETVEIAVHSLKDLPTRGPESLVLGAVPVRENVADAIVAPSVRILDKMAAGAKIGTSSQRRRAQLLSIRPDLEIVHIRGNVETRLGYALDGRLDAVMLAEAGLNRLGLSGHVTERLGPPRFLPAVGQGALALECRANDARTRALLKPLNDEPTHAAIRAERKVLFEMEGGCTIPLAAHARIDANRLILTAAVFSLDGSQVVRVSAEGDRSDPEAVGSEAAARLREGGAEAILKEIR